MTDEQKQHFQGELWAALSSKQENEENRRKTFTLKQFCVLEDFKIHLFLQLKKKQRALIMSAEQRKEYDLHPKVTVQVSTAPL